MKRAVIWLGLSALLAAPAAAQWIGEPVWNSPKGGTGVTISGDYAKPDSAYQKGNVWGGRAALGLGTLTLTAGVSTWKPEGATESITSIGGNAAMRLIGGSLIPVAVNLQAGAARSDSTANGPASTRVIGAVGISVPLPTPGFSIEPYFSPGIRYTKVSGLGNSTEFGYVFGANLSFGVLGAHVAYDNEKLKGGGSRSVFGVGLHAGLHLPLGM
jgi:opacity protein-like surface antigen